MMKIFKFTTRVLRFSLVILLAGVLTGCFKRCDFRAITTESLPDGTRNSFYDEQINIDTECRPLGKTFRVLGGSLPPGLGFDFDGSIYGTPTTPGSYNFTIEIAVCFSEDYWGFYDCTSRSRGYTIRVN